MLGRGYDNNVVSSFGHRMELMKDRGGVTRVEYNFQDLPTPAWTFLHCWRSAVGPIPNEWDFASGFAPSYVLRYMLGFKPGYYRHFGHAHSWRKNGGWQAEYRLYDNLGQFMYFFSKSQPEEAAIAAYLRQQMEQAGCCRRQAPIRFTPTCWTWPERRRPDCRTDCRSHVTIPPTDWC